MTALLTAPTNRLISPKALAEVPTPLSTPTWRPIPHVHVRDAVWAALSRVGSTYGERLLSETIEISHDGARAFGTFQYGGGEQRFSETGGMFVWRNSHDKRFRAAFLSGETVWICENGQIFAETHVGHKHTSGLLRSLPRLADIAARRFYDSRHVAKARAAAYEARSLTGSEARAWAVRLAEHKVIPPSRILQTFQEFDAPSFEYARDVRSVWGLNAAVTHVLKGRSPLDFQDRTLRLSVLLDKATEFKLGEEFRRSVAMVE